MTWLKKFLNNNLTRVLFICLLALVYIGGWCEIEHPLNPNLKLVVGDTTTDYDTIHCSNPVVSPDGSVIYYLGAPTDSVDFYDFPLGALYSVNIDGNNNTKILDGTFNALTISNDGKKLAVHVYKGYLSLQPESLILVISIDSSIIIDSCWVTPKAIHKIVWNSNGDYLYYQSSGNVVYRFHLPDSLEELITSSAPGFASIDLFKNDSLFLDTSIVFPEVNPVQEQYVIGCADYFSIKFLMRNITQDTLLVLPDSLKPYRNSGKVGFPYWFPNGNTIVFAARPYTGPGGAPAEIWVLENVFEQIKK